MIDDDSFFRSAWQGTRPPLLRTCALSARVLLFTCDVAGGLLTEATDRRPVRKICVRQSAWLAGAKGSRPKGWRVANGVTDSFSGATFADIPSLVLQLCVCFTRAR